MGLRFVPAPVAAEAKPEASPLGLEVVLPSGERLHDTVGDIAPWVAVLTALRAPC